MSCKTCGTKTYTKDDPKVPVEKTCCSANTSCTTPFEYDPEKIISECIFVEKVYDSIIINKEVDAVPATITSDPITIPSGSEIETLNITCSTRDVVVTPIVTKINGTDVSAFPTPIPGPGGIEQIDLSFIDTSKCDLENKGTPIYIAQTLDIAGQINLEINGVVKSCSEPRFCKFKTIASIDLDPLSILINAFAQLCIPSTAYAMKPSLAEFCSISCELVLPNGLDDVSLIPVLGSTTEFTVQIDDAFLILCITCEKKIKVPVQLCVLSTGFCEPPKQLGLCSDFPQLFPDQINKPILGSNDSYSDCNCNRD
ncbi:hypothetical protein [Tepidibacter mesophilus]|uniref:hypothetical protein n=1 Tax=Tepidibacter mesophilus TaxID=655607 RepID=UPI000C08C449|nr:hypothetical protein [Tepidibacter mesophilus]